MFKLLKKRKFIKFVCFILVAAFSINVVGCSQDNGITTDVKHHAIGKGTNTTGYTVYSESTFDPMTEELFKGYLLYGREFTLLVLPGYVDSNGNYQLKDSENILYTTAKMGVYKYNDNAGKYEDPSKKVLLYYVTDIELIKWFDSFDDKDNFINKAMDFSSEGYDVESPGRFRCEQLVNMGRGLNATNFCSNILNSNRLGEDYKKVFEDKSTGGMFVFFGYGSIEGYMTYNDIIEYEGSKVANTLTAGNLSYNPNNIRALDLKDILTNYNKDEYTQKGIIEEILTNENYQYGYTFDKEVKAYKNGTLTGDLKEQFEKDLISIYTELEMNGAKPGYEKLKTTYELLGSGLLADVQKENSSIKSLSQLLNYAYTQKNLESNSLSVKEEWMVIYDMIDMIDTEEDFIAAANKEAFAIKLSVGLYSRYDKVIDHPAADKLMTGLYVNNNVNVQGNVSFEEAKELRTGNDQSTNGNITNDSYLLLVTADGFVFDRGTKEDQEAMGEAEFLGMSDALAELVKMDGCPNKTLAAEMYNMIANLRISSGIALTTAGVVVLIAKAAIASVIVNKIAAAAAITPVPGMRVVAVILVAAAAIMMIGAGLISLFTGIQEKKRLEGLGASETNYCDTYVSTFNQLFTSLSLTIPVYHYKIPRERNNLYNQDLSLLTCVKGEYSSTQRACVDEKNNKLGTPITIPLYYYANREQSNKLNLEGCPMLMYFKDGELVDYISGASTPGFVVEMLRVWGLLAMREVVYKAQIDSNNNISLYHTTNTNARTHTILGVQYCITTEYMKSLNLGIKDGEFCYQSDGNKNITNVSKNITYINASKDVKNASLLNLSLPNSSSGINDSIRRMAAYNEYYASTDGYKFNRYKQNSQIEVVSESEIIEADLDIDIGSVSNWNDLINGSLGQQFSGSKIKFKKLNPEKENEYIYVDKDGNQVDKEYTFTYYVDKESSKLYIVLENHIYLFEGFGVGSIKLKKIAVSNSGNFNLNSFSIVSSEKMVKDANNNDVGYEYQAIDFLRYLNGSLVFDNLETTIPLYFTATVKETPQSNYYIKNGKKKYCKDDEYTYYRPDTFLWFDGEYECHTDNEVKAKDIPYKTTDFDSNDVRYYTASILVGDITLRQNTFGEFEMIISWVSEENNQ